MHQTAKPQMRCSLADMRSCPCVSLSVEILRQFKANAVVLSSAHWWKLPPAPPPPGPPLWHARSCDLRRDHQASAFPIEIPGKIKRGPRSSVSAYHPSACRVGNAAAPLSCSRWDLHFIQCHCHGVEMEMRYFVKPALASDTLSVHLSLKINETGFWLV